MVTHLLHTKKKITKLSVETTKRLKQNEQYFQMTEGKKNRKMIPYYGIMENKKEMNRKEFLNTNFPSTQEDKREKDVVNQENIIISFFFCSSFHRFLMVT